MFFKSLKGLSALVVASALVLSACQSFDSHQEALTKLSQSIDQDFTKLVPEMDATADYIAKLYEPKQVEENLKTAKKAEYELTADGVFYRKQYEGNSAVFVSGVLPITDSIKNIVYFTEPLDGFFKDKVNQNETIAQIYYNDKHSYNRIYPGFDVLSQYAPKLDIPTYNFYYLADGKHNPSKQAVWIKEPYVDPAGRGWMISLIKPVYVNGDLVGVPGIDITIDKIIQKYLVNENQDVVIVSEEGIVVAVSESIAGELNLPALKDHKYIETIKSDTYLTDDFNLAKSKTKNVRTLFEQIKANPQGEFEYVHENHEFEVISTKLASVGWIVFKMIEK